MINIQAPIGKKKNKEDTGLIYPVVPCNSFTQTEVLILTSTQNAALKYQWIKVLVE